MGRTVDLDDLADAVDVAAMLGLGAARAVSTYRLRYADFPVPVWASRGGRCQLWLRSDVEQWRARRRDTSVTHDG
jgi:predicted DNA-binding transcriptional regulator AlpA